MSCTVCCLRICIHIAGAPKVYRSQFAPLASPNPKAGHECGRRELKNPPESISGDGARVDRGGNSMDNVDSASEVGNQLRAGYED